MTKYHQRHTAPLLAIITALSLSVLASGAKACLTYKQTVTKTELWGLPEKNTSAVQAIIPAGSKVCIDEQLPGLANEKWGRVSFYIADDIRYGARGWMNTAGFERASLSAFPLLEKTTEPALATSNGTDADDRAMVNTLQAQQIELEALKKLNAQLKKRLASHSSKNELIKTATYKPALSQTDLTKKPLFLQQSWRLNTSRSRLNVESVLGDTLIETHRFTKLTGNISSKGAVRISVALDSINSADPMRDVRLSHLLFQSDKYPTATISASLDLEQFAPLANQGKQISKLMLKLKLHGHEKQIETEVKLHRLSNDRISVAPVEPIMISAADFSLGSGIARLIEVMGGKNIIPVIPVRFNFIFDAKA